VFLPRDNILAAQYMLFLCVRLSILSVHYMLVTTMCLHITRKARTACDLNFIVKGEGLLKVTGNHVHVYCKSGNISEQC